MNFWGFPHEIRRLPYDYINSENACGNDLRLWLIGYYNKGTKSDMLRLSMTHLLQLERAVA